MDELDALRSLRLNWTGSLEDVWAPKDYHVDGLHGDAVGLIRHGIGQASAGETPIGVVVQGDRGVGKTHLLGWAREQVQRAGGYFFLVTVSTQQRFWDKVLQGIVEDLDRPTEDGPSQVERLLADLSGRASLRQDMIEAVTGRAPLTRQAVDEFVLALRRMNRTEGRQCQDTARALALLAARGEGDQDVGQAYLTGGPLEGHERRAWGVRVPSKPPEQLVGEFSRLLALSGPTVLAVDQIDALIDEIEKAERAGTSSSELMVTQVGSGLMALRDLTRRTLTVVACLKESWNFVRRTAVGTVGDRFEEARELQNLPSAEVARAVVAKRLSRVFAGIGFTPPYPTWPIAASAFDDATGFTVRRLLSRVENHVRACVHHGRVQELVRFGDQAGGEVAAPAPAMPPVPDADLAELDTTFAKLRADADVYAAFDRYREDAVMPDLLIAGLTAWVAERGETGRSFVVDPPFPGKLPALHARLAEIVDDRTEERRQWSFRAIATDHAGAALRRLRAAIHEAELDGRIIKRQLIVLRAAWPSGATVRRETAAFTADGGQAFPVSAEDLKTFAALRWLLEKRHPSLDGWLVERQHASRTELLTRTLPAVRPGSAAASHQSPPSPLAGGADAQSHAATPARAEEATTIRIGTSVTGEVPVGVELASLRRHVAIFAGSGSGKTVLIRRIVEECALRGVSAIVLDPQNDLARLGEAWPATPAGWVDGDEQRAASYLNNVEVVVWTPGRKGGKPLSFQPLPGFADLLGDHDELEDAVKAAVEALAPQVGANRDVAKAQRARAVLREALYRFARDGGGGLRDLVALLESLPEGASSVKGAPEVAAELADLLNVAMVNDPLFGGSGQPVDPGVLLTPASGRRARVSVVSLVGLTSPEEQQGFVNRLQLALFSWFKRNPAAVLGGLLVMDEAHALAPAVGRTACTQSTLMLATQARKYGLGLVFATQSPRGLHNQIPGNATTQLFGLLNSSTQIEVAKNLARAKGGDMPDVSRLPSGTFYLATEGRAFQKVRAPMCLSHHPASPLTEEEVIARARSTVR